MSYKLLSLAVLVLSPLIPMLLIISPVFPNSVVVVRRFAKWFAGFHFIYALLFLIYFNPNLLSMSFKQELTLFNQGWIPTMGISASFAVDGFSLLLCVLTSFIFFTGLILSKYAITEKHKLYYSLILLLETSVLGIFCASDIFLFFLFWVLEALPLYFLITLWGKDNDNSKNVLKAGTKYLMYSAVSSIFLLFGILILYYYNFTLTGVLTANIDALSFDEFLNSGWLHIITFLGFLTAFSLKMAILPFHNWYTETQKVLPMPVNIILSSVILNTGAFGIIKYNMQMFPVAFRTISLILMILAVISIIYFSLTAYAQKNIKNLITYINLALISFVIIGLTTVTDMGFTGAILQIFSCSFVMCGMYIISGVIHLRTNTYNIDELGGIARKMPKLMFFAIPFCLCAIGMPFLIVFPAELMTLIGMFTTELSDTVISQTAGIFVVFSLVLIAISVLKFLHKIFYGNILSQFQKIKDVSISEFTSLLMIIIPVIIFGFVPMILINYYGNTVFILMDILKF